MTEQLTQFDIRRQNREIESPSSEEIMAKYMGHRGAGDVLSIPLLVDTQGELIGDELIKTLESSFEKGEGMREWTDNFTGEMVTA